MNLTINLKKVKKCKVGILMGYNVIAIYLSFFGYLMLILKNLFATTSPHYQHHNDNPF